ncbi:unnamed protein product [Rotaria sp. Silwood2]|nr:unnamed protein product [Rotaria sp. Silwood2]CAF4383895.1 unnamed protein product [Rotaria sp. Silwood2]
MPQTIASKNEMMNECMLIYENDEIEKNKIIAFQRTYSLDTCIHWYTRDTFLYRLVNKALRTQNIDKIFKYRFYIKDLYQQLENLSIEENDESTAIPIMYRGKIMAQDELQKLRDNINGLISINTFFSTTLFCHVAVDFSDSGMCPPQFESAVFEITVKQKRLAKPFADIHHHSCNNDEKETLFSMGTVFRIVNVELFNDEIWFVKLILNDEEDKSLSDLITHFKKEINETEHHLLILGKFLYFIGDLDKAEKYYRLLFDQISSSESIFDYDYSRQNMIAILYNNLATLQIDSGDSIKAKENYEKALEIILNHIPQKHLLLTTAYNSIANIYLDECDYELAIKCYKHALNEIEPSNIIGQAVIYNNLGEIYRQMNNYTDALINHKKVIDIRMTLQPLLDHPDLAQSYHNVGTLFCDKGEYNTALEYFGLALEIKQKIFTSNHPSLAKTYTNMAQIYRKKSNYIESLKYDEMALQIEKQHSPINNTNLATVYNNIGLTYLDADNFTLALENFQHSLDLKLESANSNDLSSSTTYIKIASVYSMKNDYSSAFTYLQQALSLKAKYLPPDHLDCALLPNNIGTVYVNTQNFTDAQKSFQHELNIYLRNSLSNTSEIATIYNNIGTLHQLNGEYKLAKQSYENSLIFDLKSLPEDHPNIIQTKQQISLINTFL